MRRCGRADTVPGPIHGRRDVAALRRRHRIDLTAATKGLTFERIQCPALRHIRCGEYGDYGNSLVVAFRPNTLTPAMAPDGHLWFHPQSRLQLQQPHDLSQLCVFGSLYGSTFYADECTVIEIPDECTVTWNWDGLSATAATTLAAFAHQLKFLHS